MWRLDKLDFDHEDDMWNFFAYNESNGKEIVSDYKWYNATDASVAGFKFVNAMNDHLEAMKELQEEVKNDG